MDHLTRIQMTQLRIDDRHREARERQHLAELTTPVSLPVGPARSVARRLAHPARVAAARALIGPGLWLAGGPSALGRPALGAWPR